MYFAFTYVLSFDLGRFIRLLLSKIAKQFLPNMIRFYPGRACLQAVPSLKVSSDSCSGFSIQTSVRVAIVVVNGEYNSCTHNGDNLSPPIKSGKTHK